MLTEEPEVPPPPDPAPPVNKTAEQIINDVFNATHPNLATKDGCGKFTEDSCTALHEQHSQAWGHIHKFEGQNQYNGHAVDALMLLGELPGRAGRGLRPSSSAAPRPRRSPHSIGPGLPITHCTTRPTRSRAAGRCPMRSKSRGCGGHARETVHRPEADRPALGGGQADDVDPAAVQLEARCRNVRPAGSQTPAKEKRAPNERVALMAVLSAYTDLAVAVVALEEAVHAAPQDPASAQPARGHRAAAAGREATTC